MIVWGIKSGIQSVDTQIQSLGQELEGVFEFKEIILNPLWESFPSLLDFIPDAFIKRGQQDLTPPWPDIILNAHPSTDLVAQMIKHRSQSKSFLVHLHLSPKLPSDVDLFVIPEHAPIDRLNVIKTRGYLNEIKPKNFVKDHYAYTFNHLPSPQILIIGGYKNDFSPLTQEERKRVAYQLIAFQKKVGGSLVLSPEFDSSYLLKGEIEKAARLKVVIYKPTQPLMGAMAWANIVVCVGQDMMSLSKACSSEHQVYLCRVERAVPREVNAFYQKIYSLHMVDDLENPKPYVPYLPLREAERVANHIRQLRYQKNKINVLL